jgi:hypothetical protein
VKKVVFQADPGKGFIASFITPVSTKPPHQFTMLNGVLMLSVTFGFFLVVRLLLAH